MATESPHFSPRIELDDPSFDQQELQERFWEAFYEAETEDEVPVVELVEDISPASLIKTLKPGERIPHKTFWFEEVKETSHLTTPDSSLPQIRLSNESQLVLSMGERLVQLENSTSPSSFQLQQLLGGIDHTVARVEEGGRQRVLRTGFEPLHPAEREQEAINALSEAGFPVPQNAQTVQLLRPWNDTLVYDWIPGQDLSSALEEMIRQGDLEQAHSLMKLFGSHIKTRWADLLEGEKRVSGERTYHMPDNVAGAFIYTGSTDPNDAFVRTDIGGLSLPHEPAIGLQRFSLKVATDLGADPRFLYTPHQASLFQAFREEIEEK